MKRTPRIELPDKRDDELPLRSLIATSIACALAGLSVAYAFSDRRAQDAPAAAATDLRAEREPTATPQPALEPPAPAPEPAREHEPASEPSAAVNEPSAIPLSDATIAALEAALGPADAAIASVSESAAIDTPAAARGVEAIAAAPVAAAQPLPDNAQTPAAPLRVEPGFFAYLRCEGLRQRKGRYPCPRDRALEERMREVVESLPSCREASAIARGMFDVRLELGPDGGVTDLHVKAPREDAERAVRACAGAGFRKLQTTLRPKRMIVSMRFRAR